MLQHGKEIEHIELGFLQQIPFGVFKNFKKLKSLKLKNVKFDDFKPEDVAWLGLDCTNLEVLMIDDHERPEGPWRSGMMEQAFDWFFKERQSTLKGFACSSLSFSKDMFSNLRLCKNLEEFEFNNNLICLDDLDMIYTLPNLKKLVFERVYFQDPICTILEKLNKRNLECLVISNCRGFDSSFFKNLPNLYFPKLERLFIDFPKGIVEQTSRLNKLRWKLIKKNPKIKSIKSIELKEREEDLDFSK